MMFNEAKYNSLMNFLEAKEISLSTTLNHSKEFRWDSEYYWKIYLDNDVKVSSKKYQLLSELTEFVKKGIFDLPPTFYLTDGGIPLIRTTDIKSPTINFNSTVFIGRETNAENYKTILSPYDLVFTKIGAYIGDVAILPPFYPEYNFSQNVAGAKVTRKLNSPYLLVFFLSKFGKLQVLRSMMISGQGKLELDDIRNYKIVSVTDKFKIEIKKIIDDSFEKIRESELNFSKVEQQLLKELDLVNWKPTQTNTAIKKFSNFVNNGRLDAEYYQPKYDEIEKKIKEYNGGWCLVSDMFRQNTVGFERNAEAYNYIEIGDVSTSNYSASYNLIPEVYLPAYAQVKLFKDDLLVPKVRPYRGAVAIIDFDIKDLIGSGAFTVLQEKGNYKKEVLATILKCGLWKELMMKQNVGSSYPVIKDDDVLNLPIPLLPMGTQIEIVKQIKNSLKLRTESSKLIEKAKQAVEIAIEKNEKAAIKFLS